jgi:hypothetical protein
MDMQCWSQWIESLFKFCRQSWKPFGAEEEELVRLVEASVNVKKLKRISQLKNVNIYVFIEVNLY